MKNGLAAGDGSGPLVLGSLRDRKQEKASTYTPMRTRLYRASTRGASSERRHLSSVLEVL